MHRFRLAPTSTRRITAKISSLGHSARNKLTGDSRAAMIEPGQEFLSFVFLEEELGSGEAIREQNSAPSHACAM